MATTNTAALSKYKEQNYFVSSIEHLFAELERIDLLIQEQVRRARALYQKDSEFLGLYITEQDIDELLANPSGIPLWAQHIETAERTNYYEYLDTISQNIFQQIKRSKDKGIVLRLEELCRLFTLDQFEKDILLVCIAPELDLRYEKLYAYLQDDVTKKRPSVELALNLLCNNPQEKVQKRCYFGNDAPLFESHLITKFEDTTQLAAPLLRKYLKVEDRIVEYLLGSDKIDSRLIPFVKQRQPEIKFDQLILSKQLKQILVSQVAAIEQPILPIFYFKGAYGTGRLFAAEAVCHDVGMGLMVIDIDRLADADGNEFELLLRLIVREALLQGDAVYWKAFDTLLSEDRKLQLQSFIRRIDAHNILFFIETETGWMPKHSVRNRPLIRIEFSMPNYRERTLMWEKGAQSIRLAGDASIDLIASRFRLSGGQIQDALITANNLAYARNPSHTEVQQSDLLEACRLHSNHKLLTLATKVSPKYTWEDIVLPAEPLAQLREIYNTVKHRATVYYDWGFDNKLSLGKGLNILFAGPSGTGKTMAAEIIAHEMGLELYKIDLSTVVSKYIGETEKNLSQIFHEAETANAILFFDEADALFGKRSEVHSSHDRYANIETGYLLQKIEEYEGVAILATNLRSNMDEAFLRRMVCTIEFPFPSDHNRLRIWQGIWPAQTPLAADVDLNFMAQRFELSGGNIKNIALAAAFLAVEDSESINMDHLIYATRREYQKMGRIVSEEAFSCGQIIAESTHD